MKEILITSIGQLNASSFSVTLPYCSEIKLLEASIPVSFNNVPAGSFTLTGGISGPHTISVAADRYTQASFATYLQTQITAVVAGYTVAVGSANNFVITSASELFSITGDSMAGYIGLTSTGMDMAHTGQSTFYNFFPSHMLIKMDKIFGIDNGVIFGGGNNLHAVPMCVTGATNYRSSENAPWVKMINLFGETTGITTNITIELSNGLAVNLNGDNWAMKLLVKI